MRIIAGPCQHETLAQSYEIARECKRVCDKYGIDYYFKASSRQFIPSISKPTLLINAKDDPFLSKSCFPINEAKKSKCFHLMTPRYGGHVGFISTGDFYWSEYEILNFINRY